MNQIDLFGKEQSQESASPSSKSKQKRPPNISVAKVYSNNQKWKECKIIGKNISIRSYSAACHFNNRFYIYGGYQILNGPLQDFYSICLQDDEPSFIWEQILGKGEKPSPRSKHALLGGKSRIYLVGGLLKNNAPSNQIHEFNPVTKQWAMLKPEGVTLPCLQSFSAVTAYSGEQQKLIIAFGFNENNASLCNAVYEYNTTTNKVSILFEGSAEGSQNVPSPRAGCAITTDDKNIYFFGGKDQANRLNDAWSFSLIDFKFTRLSDAGEVPVVRNGHTINYFQGRLYVFGGIHDITWELDDLHIYDLKTNKWTTLEQDSPRKIDRKAVQIGEQVNEKDIKREASKKKSGWYDTHSAGLKKDGSSSPNRNFSITYNQEGNNRGESPGKMLDEQRRKVFFQKKTEMLKSFQVAKPQKQKLVVLQTSSQAMKNSLDVIGNPDPKLKVPQQKLTDFGKESISKFLEPLQNNSNIMIGKKPCARDGHCGVIIGDELIIFGGDRHQMSFNDIYKLNLKLAEKQAPA